MTVPNINNIKKNVNFGDSLLSESRKQISWMTQDGKIKTLAAVTKWATK